MDDNKTLIVGDFHMKRNQHVQLTSSLLSLLNFKTDWICSNWINIKKAKKEYFKYRKCNDAPDVVILSLGNNDLKKASSEYCVSTSLLRTANILKNDGVLAVIVCSLIERKMPFDTYNNQVTKISNFLHAKSMTLDWLFYFKMIESPEKALYEKNGIDLIKTYHKLIAIRLKSFVNEDAIQTFVKKEATKTCKLRMGEPRFHSLTKKTGNPIFEEEIKMLKTRMKILSKEKSMTDEYLNKLNQQVQKLSLYINHLEDSISI